MNVSGLGSSASVTHNLQQAEIKVRSDLPPQNAATTSADSDTVTISEDAQKKLSTELGATLHKNAEKAGGGSEAQEAEKADKRTETEKKIDELKEKIKELQEQRRELIGDNSESAEEQRKQIDSQINVLNAQLVALLKIQSKEAESSPSA